MSHEAITTPFIAACTVCNFQRGWSGTEPGERQSFCVRCNQATMHKIYASHPDSAHLFEQPPSPIGPSTLNNQPSTVPMFTKLSDLLKDPCDTITMTVARESATELRVNFIPRLKHDVPAAEKGLNTPLQVTATPAELDSPAFLETLSRYTVSATGLVAAVEAVEATHKAAATEATTPKPKDKTPAQVAARSGGASVPASRPAKPEAPEEEEETDKLDI